MKYCPNCNKEYASDAAKFCNNCGTALVDKNSGENSNEVTGTMCPHCGKQISGNQPYCSFCGAELKPTENVIVTDTKKKDSNSKTTLIVIIVAVAAVIVAIGIRVYNNFRQDPETTQSVSTTQSSFTHDYEVNADAENNKDNTTNSNIDVTTTVPSTTANDNEQTSNIPSELKKYEKGLVFEGRTYRITLQSDAWYINYRSEPEYIDISMSDNNIVGKMKSGSEIYVEYIYNKTWAVFKMDGEYVKRLSFSLDCRIFFKTIAKVIKREGIHDGKRREENASAVSDQPMK